MNTQNVTENKPATAPTAVTGTPAPAIAEKATKAPDKGEKAAVPAVTTKATPKAKAKTKVTTKPKVKAKATTPAKTVSKSKPKAAVVKKDQFGFILGKKTSQAAAMYLRKNGATTDEIRAKLGSAHLNLFHTIADQGHKKIVTKVKGKSGREVSKYQIVLKKAKAATKAPAKAA